MEPTVSEDEPNVATIAIPISTTTSTKGERGGDSDPNSLSEGKEVPGEEVGESSDQQGVVEEPVVDDGGKEEEGEAQREVAESEVMQGGESGEGWGSEEDETGQDLNIQRVSSKYVDGEMELMVLHGAAIALW